MVNVKNVKNANTRGSRQNGKKRVNAKKNEHEKKNKQKNKNEGKIKCKYRGRVRRKETISFSYFHFSTCMLECKVVVAVKRRRNEMAGQCCVMAAIY